MAERNVIWTKTADIQFYGILDYWVKRNKSNTYSKKLIRLVSERTKQIAKTPYIYESTDLKVQEFRHWKISVSTTKTIDKTPKNCW